MDMKIGPTGAILSAMFQFLMTLMTVPAATALTVMAAGRRAHLYENRTDWPETSSHVSLFEYARAGARAGVNALVLLTLTARVFNLCICMALYLCVCV